MSEHATPSLQPFILVYSLKHAQRSLFECLDTQTLRCTWDSSIMASKISIPKFSFDKYVALLGNDASQTNAKEVEDHLRKSVPILQANETVELAYKCGRDSTVFTTKRLLLIDVQGMTGTKVEYLSVPYASVLAFAVETVGGWPDTDAELRLYTNMPGYGYIKKGFYKSKSDIFDVYAVLASKVSYRPARLIIWAPTEKSPYTSSTPFRFRRVCLQYCMMSRVCQRIVVWTKKKQRNLLTPVPPLSNSVEFVSSTV